MDGTPAGGPTISQGDLHMAHAYSVLLYHVVFSTKRRAPILTPETRALLFPYMIGIVENLDGKVVILNGVSDHVHMLVRLPSKLDVADVVKAVKAGSSTWFNQESGLRHFEWQEGYGAFTVSYSQKDRVRRYIEGQEAHHRKRSFAEEFEEMLVKHEVDFDRRFFLD